MTRRDPRIDRDLARMFAPGTFDGYAPRPRPMSRTRRAATLVAAVIALVLLTQAMVWLANSVGVQAL